MPLILHRIIFQFNRYGMGFFRQKSNYFTNNAILVFFAFQLTQKIQIACKQKFLIISKINQEKMNPNNEEVKVRNSISTQQSLGLNSLKSTGKIKSMRNIRVCRICLEESDIKNESTTFIKPCRCSGSLEFVHQTCLLQWLNTMVTRRLELEQPLQKIHCQICQEELEIQYRKKIVCRQRQSLRNKIKVFWPHMLASIIFISIILGAMGALAFFQATFVPENSDQQTTLMATYIVGWVVLSIALIIWIVKLLKNFFLRRKTYVGKIESKQQQIRIRPHPQPQIQNISQPQPQIQIQIGQQIDPPSQSEHTIVRRKLKVMPIKPAFRNETIDCLGTADQLNENPHAMNC